MLKKTKLRHNEYYNMQSKYDELYSSSLNGNNFYKLINIIGSEENIRLAYRNIKTNKGSKTPGVDNLTIKDIWHLNDTKIIHEVRKRLGDYKPQAVKRVFISKEGSDKKRPLGIPTIWDRLVQQSILQVLEPIYEAKFHNHSYGFRPNRSAHHALSRVVSLINIGNQHYCVDIDIKGFFDNVDHGKLLKQMWTLGIRDKSLLCVISKILKSEIEGEGIPSKGTPQGGIISPLLSNIVLNELDWWVSSQWETYKPHRISTKHLGFRQYARKYTNLKCGYIVRYADDFKIMCRTYEEAQRFYHATVDFLQSRLGLEINPDKSKVVNLKKNASDFLGFKIKVVQQGKAKFGYIAKTSMSDKAVTKTKRLLKEKIKDIQKVPTSESVNKFNIALIGVQNYYKYAVTIYMDLTVVKYTLWKTIRVRLRYKMKHIKFCNTSANFKKKARGIQPNSKIYVVQRTPLLPITGVHHKNPWNFSQVVCNYTEKGRNKVHSNLRAIPKDVLNQVMNTYSKSRSIEYNDNRISKYVAQYGKCYITGEEIGVDRVHCHHIIPINQGGNDKYNNLVIVDWFIHKLIHMTNHTKIKRYLRSFNLNEKQMDKLNVLRTKAGNEPIVI
ncbi:TPA: group II intron reverse transcriptase/maturase [Bacillus thuringiensis]|uniref:Group II intron reverse transcriptase/maturase n=1 Tax=Bacillus thuringiensis TaxID=1428 RepID=A0A9X6KIJ8_BACTU|nr:MULTISPECIES: group II intron reverse transcriptase/maturase [Bacillus cereus group]ETE91071.1 Group II intron reverse transcriptase/maturase [Bacillus thuringiensis serovar aizawai str. Leapi01]ETE97633.1 Group II intron reverse transcriptase/maturase [Bacillus thuringiensis serovar aizawai str. Hu4-2]ETE97651.1 Group II intron reverse transcriptase/maturase [Bacillus thuringiensis serovar aizawai str. Hu4-2]KAB1375395.1 group II intron reverse transcriptase/maturase [Bacillus thuringiensis